MSIVIQPFPTDPVNFELGSMGGYYTYQEMLMIWIQCIHCSILISAKEPIHTFTINRSSFVLGTHIQYTQHG